MLDIDRLYEFYKLIHTKFHENIEHSHSNMKFIFNCPIMNDILEIQASFQAFIEKDNPLVASKPSNTWFHNELLLLLQSYPSGITKYILLTQLQTKWHHHLIYGTSSSHSAINNTFISIDVIIREKYISRDDSISFIINQIDTYRCEVIINQDKRMKMHYILHKQVFNLLSFTFDQQLSNLLNNRLIKCVNTSLLPSLTENTLLNLCFLPTAYMILIMDLSLDNDKHFIYNIALPCHQYIFSILNTTNTSVNTGSSTGSVTVGSDKSNTGTGTGTGTIINNNHILFLFVKIIQISNIKIKNQLKYQLIKFEILLFDKLHLHHSSHTEGNTASNLEVENINNENIIWMILYNDQTILTNLLSINEVLLIYRPFFHLNKEEILFSKTKIQENLEKNGLEYTRIDNTLGDDQLIDDNDDDCNNIYHLLYGDATVMISFKDIEPINDKIIKTMTSVNGIISVNSLNQNKVKIIDMFDTSHFIPMNDIKPSMSNISMYIYVLSIDIDYILGLNVTNHQSHLIKLKFDLKQYNICIGHIIYINSIQIEFIQEDHGIVFLLGRFVNNKLHDYYHENIPMIVNLATLPAIMYSSSIFSIHTFNLQQLSSIICILVITRIKKTKDGLLVIAFDSHELVVNISPMLLDVSNSSLHLIDEKKLYKVLISRIISNDTNSLQVDMIS